MSDTRTPEQIQSEIEQQRRQLAQTVDQLGRKLDVKSHARARVAGIKDSATTQEGRPRPEVVAAAGSLAAMAVVLLVWRLRHT